MSSVSNIVPIAEYFKGRDQAKQVFEAVFRAQTISGWALVKESNIEPDTLETLLSELQSQGLINCEGSGLDGYFYLTGMGFQYKSQAG